MQPKDVRRLEVDALRALAHPLRVRLFSEPSSLGPATAPALADRLGESSGATGYHLRQLEEHGFVREDAERGNARDRWWERVPGPIEFASADRGARDAGTLVEMEFARTEDARFADWWTQRESMDERWVAAARASAANLVLDPDELQQLGDQVLQMFDRFRGRPEGGDRRRVDLVFRGFPVTRPGRQDAHEPVGSRDSPGADPCASPVAGSTVGGRREPEGA